MNNKFFYTIGSLACLVSLFLRIRTGNGDTIVPSAEMDWMMRFVHLLICGIALYYVYRHFMSKPGINFLGILMLAIGVAYNPIYIPSLSVPVWIGVDTVSMILFYVCAMQVKLHPPIEPDKPDEPHEPQKPDSE
jgi:hypothetical protein